MSRAIGQMDRPLGKDVLADAMMKFHELAEHYASRAAAAQDPKDREAHERKSAHYLELTGEMAHKLAPFESPRFASLSYSVPKLNMTVYTDAELDTLERLLHKGVGISPANRGDEESTQH
jgi:hypothetical protein